MYRILWAAKYDYPVGWGIKRHAHQYFQIFYALNGEGYFIVEDMSYPLEKDMYLLVAPGEYHEMLKVQQGEFVVSEVKFSVTEEKAERTTMLAGVYRTSDSTVRNLMDGIRHEGRAAMPYYKEIIANYLDLLLNISARSKQPYGKPAQTDVLQGGYPSLTGIPGQIADYLRSNLRSEITLDGLASALGYNKHYLCDVFRQTSGYTIREYLNRIRIEKAKELIVNSDFSLTQVGAWLGYEYPHHFDRLFKRLTGLTPGQYKKQETEEYNKEILIDKDFENMMQIDKT